jgi:hypothetical protein
MSRESLHPPKLIEDKPITQTIRFSLPSLDFTLRLRSVETNHIPTPIVMNSMRASEREPLRLSDGSVTGLNG